MARIDWFKVSGYLLLWGTGLAAVAFVVLGVVGAVVWPWWFPLVVWLNAAWMLVLNRYMASSIADCKRAGWYQHG